MAFSMFRRQHNVIVNGTFLRIGIFSLQENNCIVTDCFVTVNTIL